MICNIGVHSTDHRPGAAASHGRYVEGVVTIPGQFNGPVRSGNGGYVAGMLAEELAAAGPVTSTLMAPPPLDIPLTWERDDSQVRLITTGGAVIGSSGAGAFARPAPACPTVEEAESGRAAYPGFVHHPFDRCFTCGTQRSEGEGLRLFTGPIAPGVTAGPWTPHEAFANEEGTIDVPVMWAALDCPGGWAADFSRYTIVPGRMTAEVVRRPAIGEPCLSTGALHAQEGRKFLTATALHSAGGELLGRAEQVWVLVDLANFS